LNEITLKQLFYSRLYEKSEPVLTLNDINLPAASLWTGMRYWIQFFREHNLQKGERILLSLPPSFTFVYALLACIWENLTTFVLSPEKYEPHLAESLDCILDIHNLDLPNSVQIEDNLPKKILSSKRKTYLPPSKEILLFLQTSGTTGNSKWIGLSEKNLLSVLLSHLPHLQAKNKIQISTLPWSHAFGLVLDLLVGLLSANYILRDPSNGKDLEQTTKLFKANPNSFWNTVPYSIEKILSIPFGEEVIFSLGGGIIGGAPIYPNLVEPLQRSKLRVGYGQTEASPGISLGEIGKFFPFYLGQPLGCKVQINEENELEFQGKNAHIATFQNGEIHILDPQRWVKTKDLCKIEKQGIFFLGRKDASFKLQNGKMFFTEEWEKEILQAYPNMGSLALIEKDQKYFLFVENFQYTSFEFWESKLPKMILEKLILKQASIPKTPKGSIARKKLLTYLEELTL
jgi:long-subunit acyl-CoA synthetase (AMP-forming)